MFQQVSQYIDATNTTLLLSNLTTNQAHQDRSILWGLIDIRKAVGF